PILIAANYAQLAARDNVDFVRGGLLPTLNLQADLARSFAPTVAQNASRQDTGTVLATLQWPLYEGGAIRSQTRQAEQTVGQRRSQTDDARRVAVQQAS